LKESKTLRLSALTTKRVKIRMIVRQEKVRNRKALRWIYWPSQRTHRPNSLITIETGLLTQGFLLLSKASLIMLLPMPMLLELAGPLWLTNSSFQEMRQNIDGLTIICHKSLNCMNLNGS
jgi:hypothetical protein